MNGPPDPRADRDRARGHGFDPDERLGPYRLIRETGRGGMGTVYLAVRADDAFEQRVAIKILRRGMDTDAIAARFRTERQILANLDHPNIARLHDGGTTGGGLPYFAMEYVEGRHIVEDCEARGLDVPARLDLFRQVCAAVQYAHQNLVIHRDIKPANVLVTADGTPKLLDFGIAKLVNPDPGGAPTLAPTVAGLQLMTPEYASPEQVRGEAVTTATDVYSLGVLLFELLTGRRPYRITSRAAADVARVVSEAMPLRPSSVVTLGDEPPSSAEAVTGSADAAGPAPPALVEHARRADADRLRRRLAGDLDTIVLKALSKEPARRYGSVDQLSEDIRRHLAGLPVLARPDTFAYRATKFVRRHRAAVAATALSFVVLIAGVAGAAWQAREARLARARAEARFDDVRQLATAVLFEVHDAIGDLPGSTPARRLLATKGLAYLDRLAREAGDRGDLQRELAGAYLKVGDVQGRPLYPNLGDTAGALASYRKATAIYESLGAAAPADVTLRPELATAYLRLSDVLSSTGETGGALAFARKGLALQDATTEASAPATVRRALAAGHSRLGDLLSATGDTTAALAARRRALEMMEVVAAETPDDPESARQLGTAYQKLGNQLGNPNHPNVGDFTGALRHLERAAAIFRAAAQAHPGSALLRRLLAVVHSNTADVLIALKRLPDALAQQREALAGFEALAAVDELNAAAHNDVAISRSKIAEMLDLIGQPAGARREYERALAIHRRLAALDPHNRAFTYEIASDFNRLAALQARQGDRTGSLANHDAAVSLTRALSAANAANAEYRFGVGLALASRGDAYARFGRARGRAGAADLAHAERDYVEAVAIFVELQRAGAVQGTDLTTLESARRELHRIRQDLQGGPAREAR